MLRNDSFLQLSCFYGLIIIILLLFPTTNFMIQTSYAKHHNNPFCNPSACGSIRNISYPFRLKNDPKNCGDSKYELVCENNNRTTSIVLNSQKFHYENFTIRLADASVKYHDNCSFPPYSPSRYNFKYAYGLSDHPPFRLTDNFTAITLTSCPYPITDSSIVETTHCFLNRNDRFYAFTSTHTYLKIGNLNASYIGERCKIELTVLTSWRFKDESSASISEIHDSLLYGFELSWFTAQCDCRKYEYCYLAFDNRVMCGKMLLNPFEDIIGLIEAILQFFAMSHIGVRILIGMPYLLGLLLYKYKRRHLSMFDVIEGFLRSQNNLMPIRYSYSDIKKMTTNFREKLGSGGYGSVYKGKLRSRSDVAVKVLNNARANGQDFIDEVATIGRIHHVNVVRLVGYCAERSSKRALVYDFMANGSLEKYIFDQESSSSLSWEKKKEIGIGVARGIEYLHRGCDIQILHFDIKPHNVLLDENFTPKISDFGLAKFYSTDDSIVTLTAARGTIGYVAPELINRSLGEVSYKADVYSFGMLLMEMIGLKRNLVEIKDQSSQYFPYWIYNRLNEGKDIEVGNVDGDDDFTRKITKKIMIVALWCIQMSPGDRPSMSKVVEMLEGGDELLQITPQPSQSPQIMVQDHDLTSGTND